jgi:hypothetical protein
VKLMEMEEGIEAQFFQMLGVLDLLRNERESGFLSWVIFKSWKDGRGRRNSSPGLSEEESERATSWSRGFRSLSYTFFFFEKSLSYNTDSGVKLLEYRSLFRNGDVGKSFYCLFLVLWLVYCFTVIVFFFFWKCFTYR